MCIRDRLNDGRVRVTGLYSEKTGKTYDATVVLADDGQYANFKLEFCLLYTSLNTMSSCSMMAQSIGSVVSGTTYPSDDPCLLYTSRCV